MVHPVPKLPRGVSNLAGMPQIIARSEDWRWTQPAADTRPLVVLIMYFQQRGSDKERFVIICSSCFFMVLLLHARVAGRWYRQLRFGFLGWCCYIRAEREHIADVLRNWVGTSIRCSFSKYFATLSTHRLVTPQQNPELFYKTKHLKSLPFTSLTTTIN